MMEKIDLVLKYREKEYTLAELVKDENSFFSNLKYIEPVRFSKEFVAIASLENGSLKNYIIYQKYESLIDKTFNARYSLLQAYKKLHKSPIEWKGGYHGQLFVRSQFLINSILTYQSIVDNIYQIIWFSLKGDNYALNSKNEYQGELAKVHKDKFAKLFVVNDFLKDEFESITNSSQIRKLNEYANNYKHRANITIKGLKNNSMNGLINFNDAFSSDDLKEEEIDIDIYCPELSLVNNLLVECAEKIWTKLNFKDFFDKVDDSYSIKL